MSPDSDAGLMITLGLCLAPVRVKGTQHLVGFVEVLENIFVIRADQVERVYLSENVVERIARKLGGPCLEEVGLDAWPMPQRTSGCLKCRVS